MRSKGRFSVVPLMIAVLLASSGLALAQGAADPLVNGQKAIDARIKGFLVRAAEKMPEEHYSFKPSPEVRSFGQMLGHIADAQYLFASALLGEKNPQPGIEKNKTTKADIVQALKDAFAYSDRVYEGLTDAKATEMVTFFGRQQAKLTLLSLSSSHDNEHYGNLVTYMRIKGLVPPSSEPRK